MQPCKAIRQPWDKAGADVYTKFGLTFTSVSIRVPIFRKYPLSRWWIRLASDPSPQLHSVPFWMDELNPRLRSFHRVTRLSHVTVRAVAITAVHVICQNLFVFFLEGDVPWIYGVDQENIEDDP